MRSSPIVALHDEVLVNAKVARGAMPDQELSGWAQLGDAPILAKSALTYATEIAKGQIDVAQEFERVLGPRRWAILKVAMGGGRR